MLEQFKNSALGQSKKSVSRLAIGLVTLTTVAACASKPPSPGDFLTDEGYQAANAEYLEERAQDKYDVDLRRIPEECQRLQGNFRKRAEELRDAEWVRAKEIKHDNTDHLDDTVELYTEQDKKVNFHKNKLNEIINRIIGHRTELQALNDPQNGRPVFSKTLDKCAVPGHSVPEYPVLRYDKWG